MRISKFSRFGVVAILPFLLSLAPDTGAPSGGNGGGDPAPAPDKPEEPQGATLELKLASAVSIISNYFQRIGQLVSQLATATGAKTKAEGQFTAASEGWEKEKGEHGKTKGELATAKTTILGLTTERDNANENVTRLETLCALRGVDSSATVTVTPQDGTGPAGGAVSGTPAARMAEYNTLREKEKKGDVRAGSSLAFYNQHKKELREYQSSLNK